MSKDSLSASCAISTVVTPDSLNNFNGNGYTDVLEALKRLESEEEATPHLKIFRVRTGGVQGSKLH